MNKLKTYSLVAIIAGFISCGSLSASNCTAFTVTDLPQGDVDSLCISLNPANGTLYAAAGTTVGWGFTVNWSSTDGDWLVFTGSNVAGDSNSSLGVYTDFMANQGGPDDFGLPPSQSPWIEAFNNTTQLGVGSYAVAAGARVGAQDTGEITFDFEVWNGDPENGGSPIGQELDYTYAEASTAFTVNVVSPEPNTWMLLAGALLIGGLVARRRSQLRATPVR